MLLHSSIEAMHFSCDAMELVEHYLISQLDLYRATAFMIYTHDQ